ncbi:unnamed protein product [Symbiodinium sp. CCMP2456]|nr:unnamed protein product [Symbiodinium sp. CCMP2456]
MDGRRLWVIMAHEKSKCSVRMPEPKAMRWFSERRDHIAAPWLYVAGELYRKIEADQLTNCDYTKFDPAKRLRLDWAQYKGIVLRDMLHHGMELYEEIREARAMKKARLEAKVVVGEPLRIRDPWQ